MKRFEHSLTMKSNSWHARWYRYWVSLGGKRPEYKENLCHYVRVLVLWAPLRWFWHGRIKGIVPPWTIGLSIDVLGIIGLGLYLWPEVTLKILGITGVIIGATAIIFGVLLLLYTLDENPDKAEKLVRRTKPIWIGPFLLFHLGKWVWSKVGNGVENAVKWFFKHSYLVKFLTPFAMFAVAAIAVFAISATQVFLQVLLFLGIVAVVCLIVLAALVLLAVLNELGFFEFIQETAQRPNRFKKFVSGTADTVKLGATYAKTKKLGSRICPFIDFEHQAEANSS